MGMDDRPQLLASAQLRGAREYDCCDALRCVGVLKSEYSVASAARQPTRMIRER